MAKAFAGMRQHGGPAICDTALQQETSAEVPFGVMVKRGTVDRSCKNLSAANDKLFGVVQHSHAISKEELGTLGVKPGSMLDIMRQGRITVLAETNIAPGDRAHVRYAPGAGGTTLGAFRNAAVSNETIDVTGLVEFEETASAGQPVTIWLDMLNANAGADGVDGIDGTDGVDGVDGESAYTTTTSGFTMPAAAGTVVVPVLNTGWIAIGLVVFVETAGYMEATAKTVNSVTLKNLDYAGNAAGATVIAISKLVVPAGIEGPAGP